MHRLGALMALMLSIAVITSCDDSTALDNYHNLPGGCWNREDTMTFSTDTIAHTGVYGECIGIRLSNNYPFANLSLIVEQTVYPRGTVRIDTVHCSFTDERGRLSGTGLSFRQYEFPIAAISLCKGDSLHAQIRHDMQQETLPGIADIGFRVSMSTRPAFPL